MSWPAGLPTRQCSLGPDFGIVSGVDYGVDIVVTISRPYMTWGPTGAGGIGDSETIVIEPGQEQTFELPVTDAVGWYIGGLPVDVSDGKQSHVCNLTLKPWVYGTLNRKTYAKNTTDLTNLAIPTGDGVLDLDKAAATAGAQGGTVTIPNLVAQLQAAVTDAAAQAAASATAAAASAANASAITGLTGEDEAVAALAAQDGSDGSQPSKLRTTLNGAIAGANAPDVVDLSTGDTALPQSLGRTVSLVGATASRVVTVPDIGMSVLVSNDTDYAHTLIRAGASVGITLASGDTINLRG